MHSLLRSSVQDNGELFLIVFFREIILANLVCLLSLRKKFIEKYLKNENNVKFINTYIRSKKYSYHIDFSLKWFSDFYHNINMMKLVCLKFKI